MSDATIKPRGVLAFWSLPEDLELEAARQELLPVLGPFWGSGNYDLPTTRTPYQAMARALMLTCRGLKRERGLAFVSRAVVGNERAWCLVEERNEGGQNAYTVVALVTVTPTNSLGETYEVSLDLLSSSRPAWRASLDTLYKAQLRTVCASNMSKWLVGKAQAIGGRSLRPTGGIYWLPPGNVARCWNALSLAVERAYEGEAKMYRVHHELDAKTAGDVVDEVRKQLEDEISVLYDKIFKDVPGKRAVANANARLDVLLEQAETYERCLHTSLEDLKNRMEQMQAARVTWALLEGTTTRD